ncbi:MAG TPA: ubiquinol-cytochrome c reductase cytochrome b subunit [Enteractinococcus helveticum]|uniref:Cytochrome bc1 complex cytochrome b subunit n=1 Tax=Enteractinococcus helveticum TaxID=1837282 RepID=A0A921FPI5_9MICC|nr:ubiquinol-cytochrome c reductase cytochrome b subunit [Enteractinococcus helveticum]HJF14546.1 ubiquinol-cytochrome c reductase cytochrome b subunit [Enteractinococcus helveticum]
MSVIRDYKASTTTGKIANYVDTRVGASSIVKEFGRKLFPDHWSFMLGEVAMYSFAVVVLSGTFLTFFFDPSMAHVVYEGAYKPLYGVEMSAAYASTLDISFEVRGGLFMRQVHHWGALIFVASLSIHMLRVFFTGAFRRPRELNWVIGVVLWILAIAAGFTGYSLPDDVLSGNGLRIIDGMMKAIPVVGTYISFFLFGGEFPGDQIIPRLYSLHIMVVPAFIILFIALHLFLVVVHKHTQYPGPGRREDNVVGYPIGPVFATKAGGFFFIVFGIIALISGFFQINAVWNYGPYDPSPVSAGTQPDWYVGFGDGILRLMPGMLGDFSFLWHIPMPWGWNALPMGILVPMIPMGILVVGMFAWPWIERGITGDNREHHILDRPRNAPGRTAVGVATVIFYCVMWAAASSDLMATHFKMSLNDVAYILRFLLIFGPIIGFIVTKRICLALQRKDREIALHGRETGVIEFTPEGAILERHELLDEYRLYELVSYESPEPVPAQPNKKGKITLLEKLRARWSRHFFEDRVEPVTAEELAEAHAEHNTDRRKLQSSVETAVRELEGKRDRS